MNTEKFLTQLHTACAEAITEIRTEFPDHPPLFERLQYDSDSPVAGETDLHQCFLELPSVGL